MTDLEILKADLRAAILTLPERGLEIPFNTGVRHVLVYRDDVLTLLDGVSDATSDLG